MTDDPGDAPDPSAKPARTTRSIVLPLVAGAILAAGSYAYVKHSMTLREGPRPVADAPRNPEPNPLLGVSLVATAFVENIAGGRFSDAYALMAAPFRDAVPAAAFEKACKASRFLAGAKSVRIGRMTEVATPVDAGLVHAATARAQALFVTDGGLVSGEIVFLRGSHPEPILGVSIAGVPVLQAIADRGP